MYRERSSQPGLCQERAHGRGVEFTADDLSQTHEDRDRTRDHPDQCDLDDGGVSYPSDDATTLWQQEGLREEVTGDDEARDDGKEVSRYE